MSHISFKSLLLAIVFTSLLALPFLSQTAHATAAHDYALEIDGGTIIERGTSEHSFFETDITTGTINYSDLAVLTVTGLPAGVDLNFLYSSAHIVTNNMPYAVDSIGFNAASNSFDIETTSASPLGSFTLTFSVTSSVTHVTHTVQRTYTVVAPSFFTLPAKQAFPPSTPIPQLSTWEQNMITVGQFQCNQQMIAAQGSYVGSANFYDGARAFFQIGDYTGNHTFWDQCAQWENSVYQPKILSLPNQMAYEGYDMFTKGMRLNYQKYNDPNSQTAVNLQVQNNGYDVFPTPAGNITSPEGFREEAYALEGLLDSQAVGHATYPRIHTIEEIILGQLDETFISKDYVWYQPFMVGLASEALIQYYTEYNQDPRIPYILKQALDGMWNQAWRPDMYGFYYRCYSSIGCVTPLTSQDPVIEDPNAWPINSSDYLDYNDVYPGLNALIEPAYAWMFLQTGDPKYRQEADLMFANGVKYGSPYTAFGDGKGFTQTYRWTPSYVQWRQQANTLASVNYPVDTQAPTVSIVSPVNGTTVTGNLVLTANAMDNVGVANVQFKVDGVNFGVPQTTLPFDTTVATYLLSNGTHILTAVATDTSNNKTTSAPITVTVKNPVNVAMQQCPSTNIPTGSFQGCYYNHGNSTTYLNDMYYNASKGNTPPPANIGSLVVTRNDPAINFNWGTSAPASGVPNSFNAVVWQGNFNFSPGMSTFTVSKGDQNGMRVYVDDQLEYDGWWPPNPPPPTFTLTFPSADVHTIRVEYWTSYSSARNGAHVSWTGSVTSNVPTVYTLTPSSGAVNTQVVIYGSNFTSTGNTVNFGSTVMNNLTSTNGTSITVNVPSQLAAGSYNISVSNTNGTSNALTYTVTAVAMPAPTVSTITPTSSAVNTSVVIHGTNFTATGNTVNFGSATVGNMMSSANGTSITVTIPSQLAAGSYNVSVRNTNGTSNSLTYTVTSVVNTQNTPVISSLSPTSGPVGTVVTITGAGFTATGNTIAFKGGPTNSSLIANVTSSANGTMLQFTVPTNATAPTVACIPIPGSIGTSGGPSCPFATTPGTYTVSVTDGNGTSNSTIYTVTAAQSNGGGIAAQRDAQRKTDLTNLQQALARYAATYGKYPVPRASGIAFSVWDTTSVMTPYGTTNNNANGNPSPSVQPPGAPSVQSTDHTIVTAVAQVIHSTHYWSNMAPPDTTLYGALVSNGLISALPDDPVNKVASVGPNLSSVTYLGAGAPTALGYIYYSPDGTHYILGTNMEVSSDANVSTNLYGNYQLIGSIDSGGRPSPSYSYNYQMLVANVISAWKSLKDFFKSLGL